MDFGVENFINLKHFSFTCPEKVTWCCYVILFHSREVQPNYEFINGHINAHLIGTLEKFNKKSVIKDITGTLMKRRFHLP